MIMWFKKNTVKEFLSIEEEDKLQEVKQLIKHAKPKNSFCKVTWAGLMKMSFKDVEKSKDLYRKSKLIELISFLINKPIKKILKSDYQSFVYFLAYINKEFGNLNVMEVALNKADEEDWELIEDMKAAGSDELNIFGTLSTIDNLSKGKMLDWERVEAKPYEYIYSKLLMDKVQNKIQRRYQKIVTSKNKNKL